MKNKSLYISVLVSLVLAIAPFILVFLVSGGSYPKVPLEIIDDSTYYYARGVEIAQGNPFAGNPYSVEHQKEISPAFFVGDWLWSLPLILGLSINVSIVVSQIIWFLIFGIILHFLLEQFELEKKHIPWAVGLVLLCIYWYFARPVSLLVVFPVFLLWMYSFFRFLKDPKSVKKTVLLAVVTAFSLYVYTFLGEVVVAILSLALCSIFFKHYRQYLYLWFSAGVTLVLSVPFLIYTWIQIHHPFYFDTMTRIGLTNTHMISKEAIFYLLIMVTLASLIFFTRKKYSAVELYLFCIVSLGLCLALTSNVFTGKDMEITGHVGRFIELWSIIMLCVVSRKRIIFDFYYEYVVFAFYIILISFSLLFQIRIWGTIEQGSMFSTQAYSASLEWLNKNTPTNSVVFADDSFSKYVPIMTKDYVLFSPYNFMYLASDKEIQDRYLASRVFQNISLQDIIDNLRTYAGAGNALYQYMVHNRSVKICTFFHLNLLGKDCGTFETAYSVRGAQYFQQMESDYTTFKRKPIETLKNYQVSYIVIDKEIDNWVLPTAFKLLWTDGRFSIFQVN